MSASMTKRLTAMLPRCGSRSLWAKAVMVAISEGQSDTAYELARGLAHMVRNDWKPVAADGNGSEGR